MIRRLIRGVVGVAVLVATVTWFFVLRPQVIGGPATYILVSGRSMEPTIHEGSLVVALQQSSYRLGEVVVYRIPAGGPASGQNVIHRIAGGSAGAGFVMRGDNTDDSDLWRPKPADVLGQAQIVIPGAMPAVLVARSPIVAASTAAAFAVYLVLGLWAPPRPKGAMRDAQLSANRNTAVEAFH